MDDVLDFVNNLFNFALGITIAAMLWHLIHPEHFAWLKREPRPATKAPVVLPRALVITGWLLWVVLMLGAATFGLVTLLTQSRF